MFDRLFEFMHETLKELSQLFTLKILTIFASGAHVPSLTITKPVVLSAAGIIATFTQLTTIWPIKAIGAWSSAIFAGPARRTD